MKDLLIREAEKLSITEIGFAKAEVFSDLGKILLSQTPPPMTTDNIEKRINPFLIMPDAKSIIVCLLPYRTASEKGKISQYAAGSDYHIVMKQKLSILCDILISAGYKALFFCDNGDLNDRYLAYKAGLGFFGRNGFLINPRYGTYTFIGYIVTDCPMPADKPVNKKCILCNNCVKKCPGGAFKNDGFDYKSCLSYITQKKGELSPDEQRIMTKGRYIWGCDICQEVCPHNINAEYTDIPEFSQELVTDLEPVDSLSNKEFKRLYGKRAFSWRGKNVIARNQHILDDDNR